MVKYIKGIGVGLTHKTIAELDRFADAKGISRGEAIRVSISIGLPLLERGIAADVERILTILEHTQLALNLLVEEQYPEYARDVISQAVANVREYHG